ncbi:hypothetical protein Q5424_27645 [Conexibacter sp. JD483]|uniref:hypothetical protein n=1 Tax=unclassified Conexibacter TaxID=2627773 RepID=UPI002720750F|nr:MULTISPECIES: hypothetical protein [unclassified Conexibacter]MDO8189543.1 hypothetical protein [Conexibacter sp. CPCC 205706]MDO8200565.1 hypothetical protein [Conexibacter sp. CPCC 205762]MDR9372906.1 hypothetical protein [Conexibacter sp. JD483]
MSTTPSRSVRRAHARRAVVAAALAVAGLGSLAGAANADFTLSSGTIQLTDGATSGNPPANSWVSLPTDDNTATPNYFQNPSTTWSGTPSGLFTVIRKGNSGGGSAAGLALGRVTTNIVGNLTDPFNTVPFTLQTRAATPTSNPGWTPSLTFSGSASSAGTRSLVRGDLSGLWVSYGGNDYYVGTGSSAATGRIAPLTGSITGDATRSGRATITLNWNTDLASPYAPGFEAYQAKFQLVGVLN